METIMHEIKDEEMPKHSMCLEGYRLKRYKGKGGALQAMAVPASNPYSREEKEIEKEKDFKGHGPLGKEEPYEAEDVEEA